jgi:N-methylhydantoinase B
LAGEATVQLRSDRQRFAPWGLAGGHPGAPGRCVLNPGAGEQVLPSKFLTKLHAGDVFRAEMPGSGGHGNPLDRDPRAVEEDLRLGKITPHHAAEFYGSKSDASAAPAAA